MKLEKLNSWLSLLANLGVLAGIVFLAVELDQSNRQAQSNAYQARINEIDQAGREYAVSEILPPIYVKIEETGLESLTPEELERVNAWEASRAARMNGQLVQYRNGFLDEESYQQMIAVGVRIYPLWEELGRTQSSVWSELMQVIRDAM
ncbi:MAG: hypothetical protein RL839_04745 [Gammaproteobacteria bacterium]